ncbi:FtsX-like permease family protein [Natronomonas halophila]|uniref:ABC transporter permease n=1 Tax=Natronomonas halophila TaxID=2747817 RepID=UPI0015B74669|nr:FtsX-like permease family protein [Natronomonas halophila]QLD87085.1 FtsX-like permease family protein [Natronomonas halophila]
MSYRQAILFRWSRRDRLAVLVIAVTVAFLVGTALLIVAGGAQTAALASEFDATGTATFVEDPSEVSVDDEALVVPLASVEAPNGEQTLAVGVPAGTERSFGDSGRTISRQRGTTLGSVGESTDHRLVGSEGARTITASPRTSSVFPAEWYVTSPETVEELGSDGGLVIGDEAVAGGQAVPLRSALPFFIAGTEDALSLLTILVVASGLLVGVTVYSVTRISVLDRRESIRVIRSTGGSARDILGVFAIRAGLLSLVGAAVGYAIGVIVVATAVNIAVFAGVPTSLSPRMTMDVARVLAPIVVAVPVLGVIAGLVASRPAATVPPGRIGRSEGSVLDVLSPDVLDASVVVPTTAVLAAFAVFALLFVSAAGVLVPMLGGGEAVVTQSGAANPVGSQLPAGYTEAFHGQGIAASGEILLFGVVDGRAIPARGAEYDDFAAVSNATIREGRPPEDANEAVVGVGAARTLGVEPGDELPLGGSTEVGVTRVTVVGTFDAPAPYSDHVIVPLETARHLTTVSEGQVNLIRGERLPETSAENEAGTTEGGGIVVTSVDVRQQPLANDPVGVTVAVQNEGTTDESRSIRVQFGGQTRTVDVSLSAGARASRTLTFEGVASGTYQLVAGGVNRSVTVVDPGTIRFQEVPNAAPPGTQPLVRVVDVRGNPVANVSVTAGNRTRQTGEDGRVRVHLGTAGDYELRAQRGDNSANASISVREDVAQRARVDLSVSPQTADLLVRPTARVRLVNPWNETIKHDVELVGPQETTQQVVSIGAGERTTITRQLSRNPTGEYSVRVLFNGTQVATQRYRVVGDDRIAAALATRGEQGDTPFARAIDMAFGNIRILGATLVSLAGLMGVGAATATFSSAVYARRESLGIRRAAGASPLTIVRLVLSDALRLGSVAALAGTALAFAGLWALDRVGLLAMFGVRLWPGLTYPTVLGVAATALLVALVGAIGAAVAVIRVSPATLLADDGRRETEEGWFDA